MRVGVRDRRGSGTCKVPSQVLALGTEQGCVCVEGVCAGHSSFLGDEGTQGGKACLLVFVVSSNQPSERVVCKLRHLAHLLLI